MWGGDLTGAGNLHPVTIRRGRGVTRGLGVVIPNARGELVAFACTMEKEN